MAGYNSMNTLFSSLGSTSSNSGSSDMLGISYSDYASIKNGSYRKLVSAYYSKVENENQTASSSDIKDNKEKLNMIKDSADKLKDSAGKLLDKGKNSLFQTKVDEAGHSYIDYDEDKVYAAVKDFVRDYNDFLDSVSEADTVTLLRTAKSMVSYAKASDDVLASIGITVGSDNKLSVDEDKFKAASKASVQSVLQSTGGFAYQVKAKAATVSNYASDMAKRVSESSTQKNSSTASSSTSTSRDSSKTLAGIEDAADAAKSSLSKLRETGSKSLFNKVMQTGTDGVTTTDYDKDGIYKAVKSFIKDYNTLLDKTEDSNTKNIIQARKTMMNYVLAKKSELSAMGITIDSDNNLSIDETKFKGAAMEKVKNLFQGAGSLGAQIENQITKINGYAEMEASKSNTYNDNGSYTYNYTSGDMYSSFM